MDYGPIKVKIIHQHVQNVGHALGLLHSQQEDAVMQPGYPSNAFDLMELHDDDIRAVQTLYPGKIVPLSESLAFYHLISYESLQPISTMKF